MEEHSLHGIVVALKANFLYVEIDLQKQDEYKIPLYILDKFKKTSKIRFLSTCRSKLNYNGKFVKVGDYVLIESIDWNRMRAVVSSIEPRKNFLGRPALANINKIFIILSFQKPLFDIEQATRFLLTAEQTDVEICLILNKSDLLSQNEIDLKIKKILKWGYETIAVSVKTEKGIDTLLDSLMNSSLSVFCGPSGVGKTSLINKLLSGIKLPVGSLSRRLQRGKNTTRHVELYSLTNGSRIADSPGFNRPEMICNPLSLQWYFPEIRNQLKNQSCKFRDCLHKDEFGCALDKNWERYQLYRNYLEELIH